MIRLLLCSLLFAVRISADITDAFVLEPRYDLSSNAADERNVNSTILHSKLKQHDRRNII